MGVNMMSDKETELWADLNAIDARKGKLRETLDRMRSKLNRFADVLTLEWMCLIEQCLKIVQMNWDTKQLELICRNPSMRLITVTQFTTLETLNQDILAQCLVFSWVVGG